MHILRIIFKSGHVEEFRAKSWTLEEGLGQSSRKLEWDGIKGRVPWGVLDWDHVAMMTAEKVADDVADAHARQDAPGREDPAAE